MTKLEFANKIKEKYPEFEKMDNDQLADLMLKRYPSYREQISEYQTPVTSTPVVSTNAVSSGNFTSDIKEDIKQTGSNILNRFKGIWSGQKDIQQREQAGETNLASGFLQSMGNVSGGVSGAFGDVITGLVKAGLSPEQEQKVKGFAETVGTKVAELPPIESGIEAYQKLRGSSF